MNNSAKKIIGTAGILLLGALPAAAVYCTDDTIKDMVEAGSIEMPEAAGGGKRPFIKGVVSLRRLHNFGAARGFLKDRPAAVKLLSAALTGMAAYSLSDTVLRTVTGGDTAHEHMLQGTLTAVSALSLAKITGISAVLGGGMSNTKDRIKRGYVVDYFSFEKGPETLQDLVFNISDMAVAAGLILGVAADFIPEEHIVSKLTM